ncbi:hypothetical protein CALVIDRAFT_365546 [Calocera viscosa TUFC12733]|uniref:Uncharacterized protein n=1 Tax=Calocera viscosa (strain TUFC12733) TaxID=1330018 RepID=A0A167H330_CALVF|nr:hypothetical protein CALVIDRAFT_365546 [Calocera viscosa TUFC12733]
MNERAEASKPVPLVYPPVRNNVGAISHMGNGFPSHPSALSSPTHLSSHVDQLQGPDPTMIKQEDVPYGEFQQQSSYSQAPYFYPNGYGPWKAPLPHDPVVNTSTRPETFASPWTQSSTSGVSAGNDRLPQLRVDTVNVVGHSHAEFTGIPIANQNFDAHRRLASTGSYGTISQPIPDSISPISAHWSARRFHPYAAAIRRQNSAPQLRTIPSYDAAPVAPSLPPRDDEASISFETSNGRLAPPGYVMPVSRPLHHDASDQFQGSQIVSPSDHGFQPFVHTRSYDAMVVPHGWYRSSAPRTWNEQFTVTQ